MKLQIVYDNSAQPGFKSGWGFSCYLPEFKLLFDTGWDVRRLLYNMQKLNIKLSQVEKVVISHSHWDHSGGLPGIIQPHMEIIVPESFSEHMKDEIGKTASLKEVTGREKISDGLWTGGELGKKIKEQSLAVETKTGLSVITGCAHPGLENIFNALEPVGKIETVVGGLHDFADYQLLEGLKLIAPAHCTKNKSELRRLFRNKYVEILAGQTIKF